MTPSSTAATATAAAAAATASPPRPPTTVYTQGHSASVLASHLSRTVENSAAFILPHLNPDFTIVDLGCGPGTITRGFCAHVPEGQVIGIDASAEVIERARSLTTTATATATASTSIEELESESEHEHNPEHKPEHQYTNLRFEVGDITTRLPFADDSVDVVFTNQTLLHIPDPERVIREAYRIIRPGGGMLAMRESLGMSFLPANPGSNAYVESLDRAVRNTGASGFQAGRSLHVWATRAGFDRAKMLVGAGASCYAGPAGDAKWWADVHVERLDRDVGQGWLDTNVVAGQAAIDDMKAGLAAWGDCDDAWASVWQGEVICWK